MIEVRLDWRDMKFASRVGCKWHINVLESEPLPEDDERDYEFDDPTIDDRTWVGHIEAAAVELVVAKLIGASWAGRGCLFGPEGDLKEFVAYRAGSLHSGLLIKGEDTRDAMYFLVTGEMPRFFVWGCVDGKSARQEKWKNQWGGQEDDYTVPKYGLVPVEKMFKVRPKYIYRQWTTKESVEMLATPGGSKYEI